MNGVVSRCHICDSTHHFARKCPHRDSTVLLTEQTYEEQEANVQNVNITLFNELESLEKYDVFLAESMNAAVVDTACSKTVCGTSWLQNFVEHYDDSARELLQITPSNLPFRFEDSVIVNSYQNVIWRSSF